VAPKRRAWRRLLAGGFLAAWLAVAWWQTHKSLPPSTHVATPVCAVPTAGLAFIPYVTTADAFGRPVVSQGIFDAVLGLIAHAHRLIVLDYGAFAGAAKQEAGSGESPRRSPMRCSRGGASSLTSRSWSSPTP
jgi:hypothetical protein